MKNNIILKRLYLCVHTGYVLHMDIVKRRLHLAITLTKVDVTMCYNVTPTEKTKTQCILRLNV